MPAASARSSTLWQDVRYAIRTLRRQPASPPRPRSRSRWASGQHRRLQPDRRRAAVAAALCGPRATGERHRTYPNGAFAAMRRQVRTMDVAAYADGQAFTLTGVGAPVRVPGTRVSAELFPTLGVTPALGRWLRPGEDEAPHHRLAILSHSACGRPASAAIHASSAARSARRRAATRSSRSCRRRSRSRRGGTEVWVPLGLDPRNTARYWAGDFMPIVARRRRRARPLADTHADIRRFQSHIGAQFPWRMPSDWNREHRRRSRCTRHWSATSGRAS